MEKFNSIIAIAALFIMSLTNANAQMIDQTNLESYAKQQYGTNFKKAIDQMDTESMLDRNGCLSFNKEISAPGMTKDELYIEMANWFICNYDNSIQFADKDQGVLIARPFIENIARSAGGFNAYDISICPTVRAKVMDGKVLVSYSLRDYNVVEEEGGGDASTALAIGLTAAAVTATAVAATQEHHEHRTIVEHHDYGPFRTTHVYHEYRPHHTLENALLLSCIAGAATSAPSKDSKTWPLAGCYPFASKDSHKKASSKAFVMANVYSEVVVNNIESAINQCSLAYNK